MPWGLVEFQGAGKEFAAVGKDSAEFGEDPDDGLVLETLLLHPGNEELYVLAVSQSFAVFEQCAVGMDRSTLPIRRGKVLQSFQQSLVLMVTGGLVRPQGLIEDPSAVVRPDAGTESGCLGNGSRVAPGSQAVDEGIGAVDANSELQCPVVVPQGGWLFHGEPVDQVVTTWLLGGLSGSQALTPALKPFVAVGRSGRYRARGFQGMWLDFWLIARSTPEIQHPRWDLTASIR